MNSKLITIAAVLAIVAAFGFVGAIDAEDALAQQALYCDNVQSGVWPDYEDIYVSQCEAKHGPKKVAKKTAAVVKLGVESKPSQQQSDNF